MQSTHKSVKIFSSISAIWISYVFLGSIPYKFTDHPHTQHIFNTIGEWMKGVFGEGVGTGFMNYGAYGIGTMEIIVSVILLIPVFSYIIQMFGGCKDKKVAEYFFAIGGLGATILMSGAIFFHLCTPLGIEVNGDGGSLFKAAVSIWVLGIALFSMYFGSLKEHLSKCLKNKNV